MEYNINIMGGLQMPVSKEELFKKLSDAVVDMNEDETVSLANKIVADKVDAYEAVEKGLSDGMDRAGQLFEEEEYFIPELLLCSDAMYAGLEILKGHIKAAEEGEKRKVVIGVVEGDTHDIGKNLVKIMLETSGFEVFDLGRDIPPAAFVEKAKEVNADIIALATLMTTTMEAMAAVVQILQEQNIKDSYKVIIGGGPISQSFADKIGADGYAVNAADAVRLSRRLLGVAE
jgi:dimethylamine corrinoid protein